MTLTQDGGMHQADNVTGKNNLYFIETSALDATNVELAFQNILTGKSSDQTKFQSLIGPQRSIKLSPARHSKAGNRHRIQSHKAPNWTLVIHLRQIRNLTNAAELMTLWVRFISYALQYFMASCITEEC